MLHDIVVFVYIVVYVDENKNASLERENAKTRQRLKVC